ncbi:hypothetical protein [Alicyclobacillus contaminans]|uniref:hypothetical protein n=1 Tax=Alicyclobacillus contaminans TaxID=392016 RepID=UPI000429A678|nr:hypothetical protein [Alicyclobacillus contaminans]
MASFFPKALVFKEWRQQRWWGLLFLLVLAGPEVLVLTVRLMRIWSEQDAQLRLTMLEMIRFTLAAMTGQADNDSGGLEYYAFAAAAFGSIILSYDRSHGGLWYTLSGPFTRRQVLRVKATLGALFLMASLVVFAVLLYALNLGAGAGLPVHAFLRWLGCEALLQLACFVCGLMGATLVGQVYVAPLAGWLIGGLPLALSVYVQLLTGPNSANWVFTMTHLLEQFAPLYYTRGFPSGPSAMFFVCTGCWILVGYFGVQQLFRAISLERMDNFFLFPGLWHWVVFGGCCFVGLVMAEESSVDEQVPAPEMLLKHAVFTVLLWLLVRWLIRWYRKKFLEVS